MKLCLRRCVVCVAVFSFLFQQEAECLCIAGGRIVGKTFPFKGFQLFRLFNPIFQDEAGHFAAAHLGIDYHGGGFPVLQGIEFGSNDLDFPAYLFPMEQVFHFATGQIDQDTSLPTDGFNEVVGQNRFPIVELRLVLVFRHIRKR